MPGEIRVVGEALAAPRPERERVVDPPGVEVAAHQPDVAVRHRHLSHPEAVAARVPLVELDHPLERRERRVAPPADPVLAREVEPRQQIVGRLGEPRLEQREVARVLGLLPHHLGIGAEVVELDVEPVIGRHVGPAAADLLVNPPLEAQIGAIGEQPPAEAIADEAAVAGVVVDPHADHPRIGVAVELLDHRPQRRARPRGEALVGVEHQDPVGRRALERGVAGRREVAGPREEPDRRPGGARDLDGAVDRAGVDDDELVGDRRDRGERVGEERFFVAHDEAGRERRPRPAGGLGDGGLDRAPHALGRGPAAAGADLGEARGGARVVGIERGDVAKQPRRVGVVPAVAQADAEQVVQVHAPRPRRQRRGQQRDRRVELPGRPQRQRLVRDQRGALGIEPPRRLPDRQRHPGIGLGERAALVVLGRLHVAHGGEGRGHGGDGATSGADGRAGRADSRVATGPETNYDGGNPAERGVC
ncbi:MAG: hypothetical protein R3F65_03995 [bacterium]